MRRIFEIRDSRRIRADDADLHFFAVDFDRLHEIRPDAVPGLSGLIVNDVGAEDVLVLADCLAQIVEPEIEFMVAELDRIVADLVERGKHRMLAGLPLIRMLNHIGVERRALKDVAAVDDEDIIIRALVPAALIDDRADLCQPEVGLLGREIIPANHTAVNVRGRIDRQIPGKRRSRHNSGRQRSQSQNFL